MGTRSPLEKVPPLRTLADEAIARDGEISSLSEDQLVAGIEELRGRRNAVVLAHNYQIPIIQDIADFVGDSLQLAQQAAGTAADVIVFCGVHFMAETAAIICPGKKVLIPDPEAGCSLAESVTAGDVKRLRSEHPGAVFVAYVNTDAAVKAEVDWCCTSSNAVAVIEAIPPDREIVFLPDQYLGRYAAWRTGRRLHIWNGECHVHASIRLEDLEGRLAEHPGAHVLLHPECGCIAAVLDRLSDGSLPAERVFIASTGAMISHAQSCRASADVVGTEVGILHPLTRVGAGKQFVPARPDAVCSYMKAITLAKLYRSLRDEVHEVRVPEEIAARARASIERMLAVG